MILISSGLICEDEQVFSKARNNRAKTAASRHKSWSGLIQAEWKTESEDTRTILSTILQYTDAFSASLLLRLQ